MSGYLRIAEIEEYSEEREEEIGEVPEPKTKKRKIQPRQQEIKKG